MYTTIRKVRKSKFLRIFKLLILISFLTFLLSVSLFFLINDFYFKKIKVISPLAKEKFKNYSQIETLLNNHDISYSSISQNGSFYSVELNNQGKVFFSPNKDLKNQISSLQLILSRLTIEGKRFKSLDFRFDKPVLVF